MDVGAQRVGGEVARREKAEPAGLADGGGERGRCRAAGERREDDRMPELVEEHEETNYQKPWHPSVRGSRDPVTEPSQPTHSRF